MQGVEAHAAIKMLPCRFLNTLPERPLVLHASDEDEAAHAARALHAVGLFEIAGWQEGGGDEQLEPEIGMPTAPGR